MLPSTSSPSGKLLKITEYSASGSITWDSRTKSVRVVAQGEGGGMNGGAGIYGGGASGAYGVKVWDRNDLSSTESFTINSTATTFKTQVAGAATNGSTTSGTPGSFSGCDYGINGDAGSSISNSGLSASNFLEGKGAEAPEGVSPHSILKNTATYVGRGGTRGSGSTGGGGGSTAPRSSGFIRFEEFG